jgi:TPR repeat protein
LLVFVADLVVQDVPNMRANVESRAQWPLWLFLAVVAAGAGWWAYLGPGHQHAEQLRREAMLVSARSFANGLFLAVISETQTDQYLAGTPEGAFLRAVVHRYAGSDASRDEAEQWLEEAADAAIPGADTLLGWVLLKKGNCKSCADHAVHWFEHALDGRADREARLGLATALARLGYAEEARGHTKALLAEDVNDTIRLRTLLLRGSLESGPKTAEAYVEEAAREGLAEAQFALWRDHLLRSDSQARLWLAMAALQGYAPATEQIQLLGAPLEMLFAEGLLLLMTEDTGTDIGRAALWCGAQSNKDEAWMKACRLRSLEGHLACALPRSVTDTLGLHEFEQSEAYSRCRQRALADAPKVEPR